MKDPSLLERAGVLDKRDVLAEAIGARVEDPVTGPVFSDADGVHLRRVAKRLDALAKRRAEGKLREEIIVNLSASTGSIPGLDTLTKAANQGDTDAQRLVQEIAADSLRYLGESVKSLKVEIEAVTGLYFGDLEPALALRVSFQNKDRAKVLPVLRKFAENFNQKQFHVRTAAKGPAGKVYADGSFNTAVRRFYLKKEMPRSEIEKVAADSGLPGFTAHDDHLEVYFVGDPTNVKAIQQFEDAAIQARKSLGGNVAATRRAVERLWAYGDGFGATHGYGSIDGKVRPPKGDRASATAQRIASRIAGHAVRGTKNEPEITEGQAALQRRIADAFEAMSSDNLADPTVRRAYTELAAEVGEQFRALPIKVEVFEGKGQPYKNSAAMRKDVLLNNHLFIFATIPEQFGPPGVVYNNHPLLAETEFADISGRPMLVNDLLRAVHDYYAHTMEVTSFGPLGEEAAWRNHMVMTRSPWARWALTSETRGQNSWVNFNKDVDPASKLADRPFSAGKTELAMRRGCCAMTPTTCARSTGSSASLVRCGTPAGWCSGRALGPGTTGPQSRPTTR